MTFDRFDICMLISTLTKMRRQVGEIKECCDTIDAYVSVPSRDADLQSFGRYHDATYVRDNCSHEIIEDLDKTIAQLRKARDEYDKANLYTSKES